MDNDRSDAGSPEVASLISRATAAAAYAAARWVGSGDKEGTDRAGVEAMESELAMLPLTMRVVIGEGEKDDAPMLVAGSRYGTGTPVLDIAVDPVEGTSLVADDQPGGISIIGAAREGCMWDPIVSYYMDKLVVGRQCAGQVDLDAPMDETVKVIARCHGIRPEQVRVVILDRPRNRAHIDGIRRAGAEPVLIDQGDVGPAIRACMPDTGIHAVAGIGGTPEGVATRVQYLPSEERPWGGWLPNAPVKPGGSPRNTAPRGN